MDHETIFPALLQLFNQAPINLDNMKFTDTDPQAARLSLQDRGRSQEPGLQGQFGSGKDFARDIGVA